MRASYRPTVPRSRVQEVTHTIVKGTVRNFGWSFDLCLCGFGLHVSKVVQLFLPVGMVKNRVRNDPVRRIGFDRKASSLHHCAHALKGVLQVFVDVFVWFRP